MEAVNARSIAARLNCSIQNIFRLLFMPNVFNKGSAIDIPGTTKGDGEIIALIGSLTNLNEAKSRGLYTGLWFAAHGMASLLSAQTIILLVYAAALWKKVQYKS